MAITATVINSNQTIETDDLSIFSGIVECVFRGFPGGIARDHLTFIIPSPRVSIAFQPPQLSCVVSPASFAFDGDVTDALWAVDRASATVVNVDRGTGTGQVQVTADLAVRNGNGLILRVNYIVFVRQ